MNKDYTFEKKKTADEQTELTIKVNKERFLSEKAKAYKKLSANIAVPGFRPGKGPDNLLEAKLGTSLYEETVNKLIPQITLEVLQAEKLNPLSQIKYQLKKATNEEGLEYTATFVELPQIKLADFKRIKPKTEEVKVTEAEVDKTIDQLVGINRKRKQQGAEKEHDHDHDHGHDHKHEHAKKDESPKAAASISSAQEKKITDAEVKELGLGFDTVEKLREELKKRIEQEKKIDQESRKLEGIIAEAVKMSDVKVPKALIQSEADRHEHDYTHKVEDLGLKLEDFLKSQNTTIEEQRKKWQEEAAKRLETELFLIEIARTNKFTISDSEIQAEIDQIKDEKLKAEYNTDMGKRYISSVLVQQKAIKWLRDQVEQVKS